jgi:hypothetical protein
VLQADSSLKIGSVSKPEFCANKKFEKQKTEKIQIMLLFSRMKSFKSFSFLGGKLPGSGTTDPVETESNPDPHFGGAVFSNYIYFCCTGTYFTVMAPVREEIIKVCEQKSSTIWAKNAPDIFRIKSVVLSLLPVLHHIFPKSQQSCGLS